MCSKKKSHATFHDKDKRFILTRLTIFFLAYLFGFDAAFFFVDEAQIGLVSVISNLLFGLANVLMGLLNISLTIRNLASNEIQ